MKEKQIFLHYNIGMCNGVHSVCAYVQMKTNTMTNEAVNGNISSKYCHICNCTLDGSKHARLSLHAIKLRREEMKSGQQKIKQSYWPRGIIR